MGIREKLKWLDPFTYVDVLILSRVHPLKKPLQWLIFAISYVLLLLFVSIIFGVTLFFLLVLSVFYAYLLFFEHKEAIDWGVYILSAFVFAWLLYSIIGMLFGTSAPLWIVLSPSMEPVLYRGDIVLLTGAKPADIRSQTVRVDFPLQEKAFWDFATLEYSTNANGNIEAKKIVFNEQQSFDIKKDGDIVIYFSPYGQRVGHDLIIHRAVMKIIAPDGTFLLTKGDSIHNPTIDQDCGRVINNTPERACITLYPVSEKELQGKTLLKIPLLGYAKLLIFDDLQNLIFGCPKGRVCYFP